MKRPVTVYDRLESGWSHATKIKRILIYFGVYTLVFLVTFLITYSPYLIKGTSFVWPYDGRTQHYPLFVYLGRTIRQIALNFMNGNFSVPLFDVCISLGDDVIGSLVAHGLANPLALISALALVKNSEYAFTALVIMHVYLAGLSFSYLCHYYKKKLLHTLIGSVLYAFSGYAILCSMRHPYFVTPMYLLPLLIIGTEKIIKREKPYLLIFSVFYSALCGYYHLYMMTIMIGVFAIVRFFDVNKNCRVKEFCSTVVRGLIAYCLGIGLAAIPFFPAVMSYLNAYRAGYSNFVPYNYSLTYFLTNLMRLVTPSGSTGWDAVALSVLTVFAVLVLFFSKKRKALKIITIIAFAVFFTDIGNYIMNGFQYPSRRWSFGFVLLMAFITVEVLPKLLNLTTKNQIICLVATIFIAGLSFFTTKGRTLTYSAVCVGFLFLTLIVLVMHVHGWQEWKLMKSLCLQGEVIRGAICMLLVIANVGVYGIYWAAPDQGKYSTSFTDFGYETERLETVPERDLEPFLLGNPDGRSDGTLFTRNTGMVWHIPGMLTWSSVVNGVIIDYFTQMENCSQTALFNIGSTDQRTMLTTLLSEKYYVESEKRSYFVPFGYSAIKKGNSGNIIYENKYALPWGYTYDSCMSYDYLDSLNGVQKQEAMIQAVALEGVQDSQNVMFDDIPIPFEAEYKDCSWEGGVLTVTKNNAVITLNFSLPGETEGYLRLNKLNSSGTGASSVTLRIVDENVSKTITSQTERNSWYAGKENYTINLGYSKDERTSLTITIPTKGTYKLDNIELYALPMDNYPARVEALREEPLENIQWGTNRLTGTVDLSKNKILCVSVPYSNGWTAMVDGEKTDIFRGNYMFMCLPLTAGHHDIEFRYCSPGIKLGAVVSIISLTIVIAMIICDRRKKNYPGVK